MAKLVAVCRDENDFPFERRQIPLIIEDTLTVICAILIVIVIFHNHVYFVQNLLGYMRPCTSPILRPSLCEGLILARLHVFDLSQMVMEIPETVISTHYVSEDDLQAFIKVYY